MPVLVTCKFDKDRIKAEGENVETPFFSIICQWALSVAMVTTVLIRFAPKPSATFLPPQKCWERGGSVVECRTPEREVRGSKPTAAVLCP